MNANDIVLFDRVRLKETSLINSFEYKERVGIVIEVVNVALQPAYVGGTTYRSASVESEPVHHYVVIEFPDGHRLMAAPRNLRKVEEDDE